MRLGDEFVVVLTSLLITVIQVELRSVVHAASGQNSYVPGPSSSSLFSGSSSTGSGLIQGAGGSSPSSLSTPGGYGRRTATGSGPESGSFYGRSGSGYAGGYSSSYSRGGYSPSSSHGEDQQKETKYYYGGKYHGSCLADGLYYRDDTTFVICSNGFAHDQPCPPGTKTSGSPRYQPGYYYGYTDLCSVNLVDYGYGPEYYAPHGYPQEGAIGGRELQHQPGGSARDGGRSEYDGLQRSPSGGSYDSSRPYDGQLLNQATRIPAHDGTTKKSTNVVIGERYAANKKDGVLSASVPEYRGHSSLSSFQGYGNIHGPSPDSSYIPRGSPHPAGDEYTSNSREILSKSPYIDKKYI